MSTVFRVEKSSNYTVMSNFHMMDYTLSYKAKGILSEILSLPPTWDYTLAGLAALANDGIDSVRSGIKELENSGYIIRKQTRDELGRMSINEYTVYERREDNPEFMKNQTNKTENPIQLKKSTNFIKGEKACKSSISPSLENPITVQPQTDSPLLENPITDNPMSENPMTNKVFNILNTKGLNTYESNLSNQSISEQAEKNCEKIDRIDVDKLSRYRSLICSNIEYDELIAQNEADKPKIDEILENMLEMMFCTADTMRIGGTDQPTSLVQSRVMKIDSSCIEYILLCMRRNTTKVRNIKAYLRTVIFNAPSTMDSFFDSEVNNALYGQA